jgi:hypothetical protein
MGDCRAIKSAGMGASWPLAERSAKIGSSLDPVDPGVTARVGFGATAEYRVPALENSN